VGTRGFIGFVVDGTEKIAYNHWDSYPSGLGNDMLEWLLSSAVLDGGIEAARDSARALRVVEPDSTPSADDIERLKGFANLNVGEQTTADWYALLRETQGNPRLMLEAGVIEDAGQFPCDSLFAEWGYVVDFDAQNFEVYKGFQKAPHDKGRFAGREPYQPDHHPVVEYWPVALVASWPLGALPDEKTFVNTVDPSADEGE
jgi:hypothetical protein